MRTLTLLFPVMLTGIAACAQSPSTPEDRTLGGPCESCELINFQMPDRLTSETTIAPAGEPGERLVLEGTIFQPDGKTPAIGIIMYVYHTDAEGHYSNLPGQPKIRHGHLRGWIKTDGQGHYRITTIRPASYPNRQAPAHIHPIIKEEGITPYWIEDFLFDDDPLVTDQHRKNTKPRGGNGIIKLTKKDGTWVGKRDIVLRLNVE